MSTDTNDQPIITFCWTEGLEPKAGFIENGIDNWADQSPCTITDAVQPSDHLILRSAKIDVNRLVERYTDADGAVDAAAVAEWLRRRALRASHNKRKHKVVIFTKRKLYHHCQIVRGYANDTVCIVALGEYKDNIYMASIAFATYAAKRLCCNQGEYGALDLPEPSDWDGTLDLYKDAARWKEIDEDAYGLCDYEGNPY